MAVRLSPNGATGWATILRTTDPTCAEGALIRIHLCMHDPCRAVYSASRYGLIGPPIHLQEVQNFSVVPPVAEAWGDPTAVADDLTAVADDPTEPAQADTETDLESDAESRFQSIAGDTDSDPDALHAKLGET